MFFFWKFNIKGKAVFRVYFFLIDFLLSEFLDYVKLSCLNIRIERDLLFYLENVNVFLVIDYKFKIFV